MAASRNGRSARSPVEAIPDVGGQEATVDVLTRLLYASATKRRELEVVRTANAHDPDDPAAGHPVTREDGTVNSYRLLLAELDEQEQRLAKAYPEEMELVRAAVKRREERPAGVGG